YTFVQDPGNYTALELTAAPVNISTVVPDDNMNNSYTTGHDYDNAFAFTIPKHFSKQVYNLDLPLRVLTKGEQLKRRNGGVYHDYKYFIDGNDFKIAVYRLSTTLSRRIIAAYRQIRTDISTRQEQPDLRFVDKSLSEAVHSF